ncbi:MAG: CRISPR-associated endonuclease Cas2 [Bacilli bacterium]
MRSMLMFDLPVDTSRDRREYRKFVKFIKKEGFIMFQESIYVKLSMNDSAAKALEKIVTDNVPPKGLVSMLTVTEKQFNGICFMLGEFKTDIVDSDKRVIEI